MMARFHLAASLWDSRLPLRLQMIAPMTMSMHSPLYGGAGRGGTGAGGEDATAAGKIVSAHGLISTNLEAFRQMAIIGAPVEVALSTSDGTSIYPGGFALVLSDAESAQMHADGKAHVFFTSPRKERGIERMEGRIEKFPSADRRRSATRNAQLDDVAKLRPGEQDPRFTFVAQATPMRR